MGAWRPGRPDRWCGGGGIGAGDGMQVVHGEQDMDMMGIENMDGETWRAIEELCWSCCGEEGGRGSVACLCRAGAALFDFMSLEPITNGNSSRSAYNRLCFIRPSLAPLPSFAHPSLAPPPLFQPTAMPGDILKKRKIAVLGSRSVGSYASTHYVIHPFLPNSVFSLHALEPQANPRLSSSSSRTTSSSPTIPPLRAPSRRA